jgi:tetratricopeptide (TPR) repeat protein
MIYSIPTPIPKSKATKLLEQCDKLSSEDKINELFLQRLKKEAEALIVRCRHEPDVYEALGCIYTFMNKEELTRKIFHQALTKFPNDIGVNVNYAVCLNQLGFPDEALQYAHYAYTLRKGEQFILNTLIESSVFAGQFQQANQWLTQWQKEHPHTPHGLSEPIKNIRATLDNAEISDEATGKVMQTVFEILRDKSVHVGIHVAYRHEIREDDESQWVVRTMIIDQPKVDAISLNIELAERLAEYEELGKQLKGTFIVRYISAE